MNGPDPAWQQPDLFSQDADHFDSGVLELEVADAYKEATDAAAREAIAVARLALGSPSRQLSESERWRRILRDQTRPLTARRPIPERDRAELLASSGYTCVVHRGHADDNSLQVGHLLSLAEAQILTRITGDARAWHLAAARPENWIPECSKCNFGHHEESYSPAAALTFLFRCSARPRNLDGAIVLEIIDWLRKAEEWRPR
jgi:hypothetical protein